MKRKRNDRACVCVTVFLGNAAAAESRLLRRSPRPDVMDDEEAAVVAVGPLVVDDWRRIHGKLPNAMSTSDSRRPLPLMLVRDREDDPPPPPVREKKGINCAF